jgi:D-glycero-D-manno-heptose 1,7-bisphosphate phosphatase
MTRPAVFFDRDGTLVEDVGYLQALDQLTLFPWTVDALRLLNRAGFAVVIVTNQSAVGRGLIDEAFVELVHGALGERLAAGGARLDGCYFCPHHPDAALEPYRQVCTCRKPAPGMVERACAELAIDPAASFMVGDRWRDIACGHAAGLRSILVRTGAGALEAAQPPDGARADAILSNAMEAVGWILRTQQNVASAFPGPPKPRSGEGGRRKETHG